MELLNNINGRSFPLISYTGLLRHLAASVYVVKNIQDQQKDAYISKCTQTIFTEYAIYVIET